VGAGNTRNRYLNNTITNTQKTSTDGVRGMWLGNGGSQTEINPTVTGNTIQNVGATGLAMHPVGAMIANNLVVNAAGAGVKVVPGRGMGGETTIQGNTLRGCLYHGVQIDSADSPVHVLNNTIDGNIVAGIYESGGPFSNSRITGNIITNNNEAGIYLYNAHGVTIQGNQFSGNKHGMTFETMSSGAFQNVQISGNTLTGQRGNGIFLLGRGGTLSSMSIGTNSFTNGAQWGISIEENNAGGITGVTATGNCFCNNSNGTIFDNRSGGLTPVASSPSCSGGTPADTTPPTVSLSTPGNNQTVSGTVTMTASANDAGGIAAVQYQLNGSSLGAETTASPYSYLWDSRSVGNGTYALTAVARDKAGNKTTSAAVYVNVANSDTTAPSISFASPASGATVSGTAALSVSAADNIGVAGVQYTVDGAAITDTTVAPYSCSWNTANAANGTHTLTATARDAAGNRRSASITVTVSNAIRDTTAPSVSIISPANGQRLSGTVSITASASDNIRVVGVQLLIDGAAYGSELTSAPYSLSWNTVQASNATHRISAIARDAAGNRTTSAAITVTVSNTTAPPPVPTGNAIRVNCGGGAFTDANGNAWAADTNTTGSVDTTTNTIANTSTPALYQNARWNSGPLSYQFSVPNGTYNVTLKFAELYFTAAGQHKFNASINGAQVLSAFDIFAQAGGAFRAIDKTFPVTVTGGTIAILLTGVVDDPIVSAIEIVPQTVAKVAVRMNCGGGAVTDASGNVWAADTNATGSVDTTANAIANTNTPALYQNARWNSGPLTYQFAVPNGTYRVTLKFAELYFTAAGQHKINASINGQQVLSNFDILAQAGGQFRAVDRSFTVTVTGGTVTVQLTGAVDDPIISAIEIVN
jgi:parallel beta-helix repeat protein